LPDIEWVVIAPGDVLMGDRRIRENGIQPAPSPIDHAFRISRYPVTVAQFQAFVDDGGYEKEYLWSWSVEAQQWFTAKKNNGANRNEKLGPKNFESVFQTPNHPRVGICWFEAMAFCKWLNEKRGWDKDSIRLPSEQEWVRALGGAAYRDLASTNLPAKQCNIFLSLIGHTSAVNLFPEGDTARESGNERGVADLIGNVWEWCCTQWTDHPQNTHDPVINNLDGVVALVARGGSWTFGTFPRNISELRRGYGSGYCDHELGFRLAHGGETAPTRVRTTGTTEDSDASRRHQPRESVSPGSVALPPQDAQLARDLSLSEDDILAITDYWDATNTRRLALIQKKLAGKLSPEERIELADLKRLARAKATLVMPLSPPELEEKNERQQGRAGSA
jgi:formylglycine-generating enzyme required for sulfatase activity